MRGLSKLVDLMEEEHDSLVEELRERKAELKKLNIPKHDCTPEEDAAWLEGYIQALEEMLTK